MGIYIKGMEMPTKGYRLILVHADGTAQTTDGETTAISVPEHGRLIDEKYIVPKDGYIITDGITCIPVKDIVNAPTIIPASKESE